MYIDNDPHRRLIDTYNYICDNWYMVEIEQLIKMLKREYKKMDKEYREVKKNV